MANGTTPDIKRNLQLAGQWILIVLAILAGWVSLNERVVRVEEAVNQEQHGYNILIESIGKRMDRLEKKIDQLIEKAHVHRN